MPSLFQCPTYVRYLALGARDSGRLWDFDVWNNHLFPCLDELVRICSDTPSVQSRQLIKGTNKQAKLGRLTWSEAGNQRWCHNSVLTKDKCKEWDFIDTQVFCPSESVLAKRMQFPEIHIQIAPLFCQGEDVKALYDQFLHVAVRRRGKISREQALHYLRCIASQAKWVGLFKCGSRVSILNEFESLVMEDFVYRGMGQDVLPDLARTRRRWRPVELHQNQPPGEI